MKFTGDKGEEFSVSFSGGIAEYPKDGESVFELVQVSDRRLYLAKKRGRNQIVLDDAEAPEEPEEKHE
jgi:PleD family two-component response regulator